MRDIPKKQRRINAMYGNKKHLHNEIIEYYNKGKTYKQIMKKFNISSKGIVSYIIKKSLTSEGII